MTIGYIISTNIEYYGKTLPLLLDRMALAAHHRLGQLHDHPAHVAGDRHRMHWTMGQEAFEQWTWDTVRQSGMANIGSVVAGSLQ